MSYKIIFYGKDNSKIEDDLDFCEVYKDGLDITPKWEDCSEKEKDARKNCLLKILEEFQKKISHEDIFKSIINKKTDKKDDYKLFSKDKDGSLCFGNLVGVIYKSIDLTKADITQDEIESVIGEKIQSEKSVDVIFKISSRFDGTSSNKEKNKPHFLLTMLFQEIGSKKRDLPSKKGDMLLNTDDRYEYLFDVLLLYYFKAKFKEASRKGLYKTYCRFERNDDKVKGAIDIARHIKENMGLHNGKIAYSYYQNTTDNYLNHLIVAAYNHLKRKYSSLVSSQIDNDVDLKRLIDNLQNTNGYLKYDNRTLIMKNLKVLSHPFYVEYEELRKICLRILRDEGAPLFDVMSSDEAQGAMVYIPDLWEDFLESYLKNDKDYFVKSQEKIRVFDSRHTTYPDYVFYSDKEYKNPFMILDAKFKEKWGEAMFDNKKDPLTDILGDYDKCIRDMRSIGAYATGVIFPTNKDKEKDFDGCKGSISHKFSDINKIDRFYTFPVFVPHSNTADYGKWLEEFENNCNKSAELIKKYALEEKEFNEKIKEFGLGVRIVLKRGWYGGVQ